MARRIMAMRENEFTSLGKAVVTLWIAAMSAEALVHVWQREPQRPLAFSIAVVGFLLFLIAKLSVVARKQWVSFGAKLMSPAMGNTYRIGYWLMAVGILATFV
jgi:hypothetical protein